MNDSVGEHESAEALARKLLQVVHGGVGEGPMVSRMQRHARNDHVVRSLAVQLDGAVLIAHDHAHSLSHTDTHNRALTS